MQLDSDRCEGMPVFGGRGGNARVGPGSATPEVGIFDNPMAKSMGPRYTADGRKISIRGVPERVLEPQDLWTSAVHASLKKMICNGGNGSEGEDFPDRRNVVGKEGAVQPIL